MVRIAKAPGKKTPEQIRQDKQSKRYVTFFFALIVIATIIALFNITKNDTDSNAEANTKITGQAITDEEPSNPTINTDSKIAKSTPQPDEILKPNIKAIPKFILYNQITHLGLTAVEIADINKDNYPDVIIGSSDSKTKIYLNNRKDGFGEAYGFDIVKSNGIASADYDNDGNLDFALGITQNKNYVFYNDKSNNFPNKLRLELPSNPTTPVESNTITAMVAFDFNHDGLMDIAASRDDNQGNSLYINSGSKQFVSSPQFGNMRAQEIAVADFNNDGWMDVLTANYNDDSKIYFNRGTKKAKLFDEYNLTGKPGNFIRAVDICDLNNDGWQDIVSANYQQESKIYINNQDKTFTTASISSDRKNSIAIGCADFNNDGWQDVIIINYNEASHLFMNNQTKFIKTVLDVPGNINELRIADFNHDGYQDLFLGSYLDKSHVVLNSLGKVYTFTE